MRRAKPLIIINLLISHSPSAVILGSTFLFLMPKKQGKMYESNSFCSNTMQKKRNKLLLLIISYEKPITCIVTQRSLSTLNSNRHNNNLS